MKQGLLGRQIQMGKNKQGKCLLCQSTSTDFSCDGKIYFHCPECDLIFLDPFFRPPREEEKKRYESHQNSLDNEGYVEMFEKFMEKAVLPFFSPPCLALDFGCGPEPVLKVLLERKGITTEIYDPFFAPKKFSSKNKYDLITCTEVLEHVFEPLKTWDFFLNHLKKEGCLSLMTLLHPSPDKFREWWYKNDLTHVTFYSLKTFQWIENKFPLKILYTDNKNTLVMKKLKITRYPD